MGLGIPNPIHDWVYGGKAGARTASALKEITPLDTTDGNMSSPTFSDPLVAARGRDAEAIGANRRLRPRTAPHSKKMRPRDWGRWAVKKMGCQPISSSLVKTLRVRLQLRVPWVLTS